MVQSPVPVSVRIVGAKGGDIMDLTEFTTQAHVSPLLFVNHMCGQKDRHENVLVELEELSSGRILYQQVLKFSNPLVYTNDVACEWFQLVERKLSTQGIIDHVCSL